MNCGGCGTLLEPTAEQVDQAVDEVLAASMVDSHSNGGVCPLCGHLQVMPFWNRRSVLFSLMVLCLFAVATGLLVLHHIAQTERSVAVADAVLQVQQSALAQQFLGNSIVLDAGVTGTITHDETGWMEARLRIPVHGPKGKAVLEVTGGRSQDAWAFSPFEVIIGDQHKTIDLVTGKVMIAEPDAYLEVHGLATKQAEYLSTVIPEPRMDGTYPCVAGQVDGGTVIASLGRCQPSTVQLRAVDQLTVDLRYGSFVLRQSDAVVDNGMQVLLTRSYRSDDWIGANRSHAFGRNSNHPYDVALLGSRNPYTYLDLVLEDGDFLHFDRITEGNGYADAVYRHTETSTRFYKATVQWNGHGWTMLLADGSRMEFPESYRAVNLAQGAVRSIEDGVGRTLTLQRDKQRNLLEIDGPDHPALKFRYDDQARIVRVDDSGGCWTTYVYSADGFLADVTFSSGTERHYAYEEGRMTTIKDEHSNVLLRNTYSKGLVIRQEYAGGQVFRYAYRLSPDRLYVTTVLIVLPDGRATEVQVDGVSEAVKEHYPI